MNIKKLSRNVKAGPFVNCQSLLDTLYILQLPSKSYVNGQIIGYRITYTPQGGQSKTLDVGLVNTCALTSLKAYTWYNISVAAESNNKVGPSIKELMIRTPEDSKMP